MIDEASNKESKGAESTVNDDEGKKENEKMRNNKEDNLNIHKMKTAELITGTIMAAAEIIDMKTS